MKFSIVTCPAIWSILSCVSSAFVTPSIKPRFLKTTVSASALSVSSGSMNCRPIGIGSAAPETVISNVDLESVVETSDEWIKTRTGISNRHVLQHGETLRELEEKAARKAIEMAEIDASDIDLVICCTSSADDIFGDAPSIANSLGCTKNTIAFDLTAACSGFMFGTITAGQFLSAPNSNINHVLVIGADSLTRWIDWDDRNSCILFGDGAGAMVLKKDDDAPGILGYSGHSIGSGYENLRCGYVGKERKISTPGDGTIVSDGSFGKLTMNGMEVYKFATREVPKCIDEAMEAAVITIEKVDWLLLHQANIRIMETVAKRLGISMDKCISNLDEYGNTSAASIPIALDEAVRSGKVKKGDVIACAGFGAGLSLGAAIIKW